MKRWQILLAGTLAAGAVQFGASVGVGVTGLALAGFVVGQMGATALSLLVKMPQEKWTAEKRAKHAKKRKFFSRKEK